MKKIFFTNFLQNGKYHYEIRENDIRGKLIKVGKDFNSKQIAARRMNYQLKKLSKKFGGVYL